jgi:FSR family fosmidomycin resistance protein-like MFS transporter
MFQGLHQDKVMVVVIWTGFGLLVNLLLIPLLEKVEGLKYLRFSAFLLVVIYPAFLFVRNPKRK